jgi:hypothetical protein
MKTFFLRACCIALSACSLLKADSVSVVLAPLPDFELGGGTESRTDILSIDLGPNGPDLIGQPGQTVGWSFQINWASNAGDSIVFNGSELTPASAFAGGGKYVDIIGELGGNQSRCMLANTVWSSPDPFNPSSDGIGYFTIDPDAIPGTTYQASLLIYVQVFAGSGDQRVRLDQFIIPIEVSVTVGSADLRPQVITLPQIPDKQITDTSFVLNAASDSGLPITYLSLTPNLCTVEDGVVAIHDAGDAAIVAIQDGNALYSPAESVTSYFPIRKNEASIAILGSLEQAYDGNDKGFTATTQPEGLQVKWLYNGMETPPREPGIHIIDALIEDPTYTGKAQARLMITDNRPAPLTNYQTWLEANFSQSEILDGTLTAWNQEPAGDEQMNLMKYALGFDAKTPASSELLDAFPRVANPSVPGSVIVELPAIARADLSLRLQASSNLVDWEEIARRDAGNPWTGSADVFSGTATPDGTRIPTLVTEPQPAGVNRFYRLQVSPFP